MSMYEEREVMSVDAHNRIVESLRQQLETSQKREVMLRDALVEVGQWATCYRKNECIDGETRFGKGSYEDGLNSAMGGKPWQICSCFPPSYFEALAATADLDGLIVCHAEPVVFSDRQTEPLYRAWGPK